jgi:hypothetical protein
MFRRIVALLLAAGSLGVGATVATGIGPEIAGLDSGVSAQRTAVREQLPRTATIIGDSAMAGVRWNGALGGLRGFFADDRLESCRRLVDTSCRGREGRRPPTVLIEINLLPSPTPGDVLIVATGYNDVDTRFASHARFVLDAAVAKGYETIAWVTYREDVTYELPGRTEQAVSNYRAMNAELRRIDASGEYSQLQLWDLHEYTRFASGTWFYSDGVHQLTRGSWGIADWISRKMAHVSGRPCPMPWAPTVGQQDPCPDPNVERAVRGYPDLDALYDF